MHSEKNVAKFSGHFLVSSFLSLSCNFIHHILLGTNDSLDSIDLSWNNFRGRSAIDLMNGMKVNE